MLLYVQQVDDGILAYRSALEGADSDTYYIGSKVEEFAYMAKECAYVCVVYVTNFHIHTYIHTYRHTYNHVYRQTYSYVHICTCMHAYIICICRHTYIRLCIHTHIYTYIYMHARTYTHTYLLTYRCTCTNYLLSIFNRLPLLWGMLLSFCIGIQCIANWQLWYFLNEGKISSFSFVVCGTK